MLWNVSITPLVHRTLLACCETLLELLLKKTTLPACNHAVSVVSTVVLTTTYQIDFPKLFFFFFLMNLQLLATKLTGFTYSPPPLQLVSVLTLCFLQGKTLVPVIEKSHTVWLIRESWEVQHNSIRGARLSFISSDSLTRPLKSRYKPPHPSLFFLPLFCWFKYVPVALMCLLRWLWALL